MASHRHFPKMGGIHFPYWLPGRDPVQLEIIRFKAGFFLLFCCDESDAFLSNYITKPFRVDELLARILAHLRREERKNNADNLKFDEELIIDYNSRMVFLGMRQLDFSNKEFEIIRLLSQNVGIVFDRETIYERLWGYDGEGDSIVVKEHIRKIRNKMANYTEKNYIETVWGVGYRWIK